MKHSTRILALSILTSALISCGGNGSSGGDGDSSPRDNTSGPVFSGTITTPDGKTPLSGATIYLPDDTAALPTTLIPATLSNRSSHGGPGMVCDEPSQPYLAYACSNSDGVFELALGVVWENQGTIELTVEKGIFRNSLRFDVEVGATGAIQVPPMPITSAASGNQIAVVTGHYDRMEDILAKMGFGEIGGEEDLYQLIPGTESFDLYSGDDNDNDYPSLLELLEMDTDTGAPRINGYDLVFINCGNDYEQNVFDSESAKTILRNYVNGGGRLYITDQSYDFPEQLFPEYIDFLGSDDIAEDQAEYVDDAQFGVDGLELNAGILDASLADWLENVECESGPCKNPDGSIVIRGFLSNWAVMEGIHSTAGPAAKVWIQGDVEYFDEAYEVLSDTKPLTISFTHGQGQVLFTSYHTEDENPSAGFWPQERVLQYLIFEI